MNKIVNIAISILVVAAVMLSSVVQFHHHSLNGEIHVYDLLLDLKTTIDCNTSSPIIENDCCTGTDNHSPEKKDCSLKIGISKPSAERNNILPLITWLSILTNDFIDINPIQISKKHNTRYWYSNLISGLFKPGSIGLRSPPLQELYLK